MGQHYTKNTVETQYFCRKCYALTSHRVLGGKLAGCIPCSLRPTPTKPAVQQATPQPTLFE